MQENWFKDWFNTPYYHLLYKNRDEQEAANFIDKLLSHLRPAQNSKMLDVACGKGRHAIQMSNKGFDVTGIDLSEESIQIALEQAIKQLPEKQRFVFMLRYFEELSYEKIAEVTGTTIGGAKANFHQALKKMEEILKKD